MASDLDDAGGDDLLALLAADHRRIVRLIDEAAPPADVVREIAMHLSAETQLLYREARNEVPADPLVDQALDLDHRVEELAAAVDDGRTESLADLDAAFAAHIRVQEDEIFPKLQAVVSEERLLKLAGALETVVRMAPTHPHPHGPDEGGANVISDALAAALDQIEDLFRKN
jgi:hypothetical protein